MIVLSLSLASRSSCSYKMVEVPHIVRSEEAAFYNSPNFEDQNEKAPPAIKDSIVLVCLRLLGFVLCVLPAR